MAKTCKRASGMRILFADGSPAGCGHTAFPATLTAAASGRRLDTVIAELGEKHGKAVRAFT